MWQSQRPAVVVGQRAPEGGPVLHDLGQVAAHGHLLVQRAARGADELADLRLEAVDVLDEVGRAVALGIEAQRGERGAEAVGEVGDPLALGGEELVDAVGQQVEGLGDVDDLGRTRVAGAGVRVPAGQRAAGAARSAAGRVTLRASRSVATTATTSSTTATRASTAQDVATPSVTSASGTWTRSTTTSPVPSTTGL